MIGFPLSPAKKLYAGSKALYANDYSDDIFRYEGTPSWVWPRVGGPGAAFAVNDVALYGISPDGQAVMRRHHGTGEKWTRIGGLPPGEKKILHIWAEGKELYIGTRAID
ncbi:hypothetical protein FJZ31_04935 [Candidatus Poribacteria bacterium]|nr:hypothetical protein [Candidatus Poribacteria bacterium]